MSNGQMPECGWQVPGNVPGAFDWWLFGGILTTAGGAIGFISQKGIPGINGLLGISSSGPFIGITSAAVGALIVLGIVSYYLLRPDGCVRGKPRSESVCCAGIVESVSDKTSTPRLIFAPFTVGPSYLFYVVLKSPYLYLITLSADFVICSTASIPLLQCVVKSEISCGARKGAMVGAAVAAGLGIILGYLAGAAIVSLACGPFALLCLILAVIVAALVAAAVTYAGAMVGGWVGAGIAAIGEDQVEETAKSLTAGTIVTVTGDWSKNPDVGFNELFYVTSLNRTGMFNNPPHPPPFTVEEADTTPQDDCPPSPPRVL